MLEIRKCRGISQFISFGIRKSKTRHFISRCYSSQASQDLDDNEMRLLVLQEAMNFVQEYGWTQDALARGAKAAKLPQGLVIGGPVDLVHHFLVQKRYQANNSYLAWKADQQHADAAHGTLYLMEEHLCIIHPYRTTWPAALALLAHPTQAVTSFQFMQQLASDFSRVARVPTSAPSLPSMLFSFVGRSSLATIYSAAELYLLSDESDNIEETRRFLKDSLETYFTTIHSAMRSDDNISQVMNHRKEEQ